MVKEERRGQERTMREKEEEEYFKLFTC